MKFDIGLIFTLIGLFVIIIVAITILLWFYLIMKSGEDRQKRNREELIKSYQAPDYESARKIKFSGFSNHSEYLEAEKIGANTDLEYNLALKYNKNDFNKAKELYYNEIIELIHIENEKTSTIELNELFDLNSIEKFYEIPVIMTDLINLEKISGVFNDEEFIFNSDIPSKSQFKDLQSLLEKLTPGIPVQIERIASQIDFTDKKVISGIEYLLSQRLIFGKYLTIEGVFIKAKRISNDDKNKEDDVLTCNICYSTTPILEDDAVWCPHCVNSFHYGHISEWVKMKGECPICQTKINAEELIKKKI